MLHWPLQLRQIADQTTVVQMVLGGLVAAMIFKYNSRAISSRAAQIYLTEQTHIPNVLTCDKIWMC